MIVPFFLLQTGMNAYTGEVAWYKKFIQLDSPGNGLYENDNLREWATCGTGNRDFFHLVEFERIQQFVQFTIFADLFKGDVVLL